MPVYLGTRSQAAGSCSCALQAMRSIRQRLSSLRSCEIANEQKLNFAPYSKGKAVMKTSQKHQSWTVKLVCLSNMGATKVPCSAAERELLVQAGLGEKN